MSIVVAVVLLAGAEIPVSMDPAAVPNYQVLRPALAVAGKPSAEALGRLKEQGFKTVVDLRTEAEGTAEEKAIVEGQGLRYVSVPITAADFRRGDALAVGQVLDDPAAAPVLLHCSTSNRVGGVWAVLQAKAGLSVDEAIEEGRKAGLKGDAMVAAVRSVIGEPHPNEVAELKGGPEGLARPMVEAQSKEGDQPPRPIKVTRPEYPREAFDKKIEGTVELEFVVDATGRVAHVRVVKSIPLLDQAAIETAYRWQFAPATRNGRPVAVRAHAPVTFRLY